MSFNLFYKLCDMPWATFPARVIAMILPNRGHLRKYRNILLASYEIGYSHSIIKSNPIFVQLAPSSTCNYRCLFCEIHKDDLLYPNRVNNMFTLEDIHNYESFLSTVYKLIFSGGTAEPLLNKDFGNIAGYMKKMFGTKMTVNTNGSMLTFSLTDTLVESKFDKLLVSYHAGSNHGYRELMTGNVERVDQNLIYLKKKKQKMGRTKPEVQFNFALQKLNQKEYSNIFDKADQLGAASILISKYYGGRNKLQDRHVAFDYDIEEGNRMLNEIYDYAKRKNVVLSPSMPPYWRKENVTWNPENFDFNKRCTMPWMHLHFKPVYDDENSHYVGVCNRIEIFKVDYRKAELRTKKDFDRLWNHPVLQYLRQTVNERENINPLCKYCKNYDREMIRNTDADKYAEVRDRAQQEFLNEFQTKYKFSELKGIEVLKENPHLDERFKEKSDDFNK